MSSKTKNRQKKVVVAFLILILLSSNVTFVIAQENDATEVSYVVFTWNNILTEDMRQPSDITEEQLIEYLKKFPDLEGLEKTLLSAQDDYNVNLILLLSIIRLESGNGKSKLARNKNNLGGITGLNKYGSVIYRSFDTKEECVEYMAKLLSEKYLTDGGRYFRGYTVSDIAKCYCQSSQSWIKSMKSIIYEIQEIFNDLAGEESF